MGAYSVSKTALLGLTKAAAQDLAPEGIRVNCVAPGIIKTTFSKAVSIPIVYVVNRSDCCDGSSFTQLYETKTAHDAAISTVPMGRLGETPEIAGVVSFLVSDDASYITGETIVASGGMPSRL